MKDYKLKETNDGKKKEKKRERQKLTYLPHLTSEYITMKSPSCRPLDLTKSPEDFNKLSLSRTFALLFSLFFVDRSESTS